MLSGASTGNQFLLGETITDVRVRRRPTTKSTKSTTYSQPIVAPARRLPHILRSCDIPSALANLVHFDLSHRRRQLRQSHSVVLVVDALEERIRAGQIWGWVRRLRFEPAHGLLLLVQSARSILELRVRDDTGFCLQQVLEENAILLLDAVPDSDAVERCRADGRESLVVVPPVRRGVHGPARAHLAQLELAEDVLVVHVQPILLDGLLALPAVPECLLDCLQLRVLRVPAQLSDGGGRVLAGVRMHNVLDDMICFARFKRSTVTVSRHGFFFFGCC